MKARIFKSLPSLVAIQAFVVCAELKSINKAAGLLHRSQGAISKQIRQLEEHYNVILFERTTTGLELTKKGIQFLDISEELLKIIGKYEVSEPLQKTEIRLSAPSTFTLRWLLPRMERIKEDFGDKNVQISSSHHDSAILDENLPEVAITRGSAPMKGVISVELFPELLTPMCSHSVMVELQNNGFSLQGQNLLHASKEGQEWAVWLENTGISVDKEAHSITFDTLDVALSAAEASMGLAIGDPIMAAERLSSKRLFMPFRPIVPSGKKYFACYLEKFSESQELVKLVNCLSAAV